MITLVASLAISYVLGQMKPTPDKNITERKSPIVSSITLKKENIKISIDSQGMVAPLIETILSAEVSGTIVKLKKTKPNLYVGSMAGLEFLVRT